MKNRIRFKLRALLIATALICVFLGLQIHVHYKAKRYLKVIKQRQAHPNTVVLLASPTLVDYAQFERRILVWYHKEKVNFTYYDWYRTHRVGILGEPFEGAEGVTIPQTD